MRKLLIFLAFAAGALAQPIGGGGNVPIVTTTPATCIPNVSPAVLMVSANGTSGALYYCSAVNTWTAPGGSGTFVQLSGDAISTSTGGATTINFVSVTTLPSAASALVGRPYRMTAATAANICPTAGDSAGSALAYCVSNGTTYTTLLVATGATGNAPVLSAANMTNFPTLNQNTTGTASNVSGTPALPNGVTATTQAASDNSTKLATTAYVDRAAPGTFAALTDAIASASVMGTTSGKAPVAATGHALAAILTASDSSGSGTAQTASTSPTFTPAANDCVWYTTTTTNSGTGLTVNINSLGAKSIAIPGASGWTTTLTASIIPANTPLLACYTGTNWNVQQTGTAASGSSVSGITTTGLTQWSVYYEGAAFALTAAKADSATTLPAVCVATLTTFCATSGIITNGSWTWSVGPIYVSDSSAGALTQTAPSTSGHFVQKVGDATSATAMIVNPSVTSGIQ